MGYTAEGGDLLQTLTFNYSTADFENPHLMGDVYGASQLLGWVDSTGKTSTIDPKNALTNAPTNAPKDDDDCPTMEEIDQSILQFLENEAGLDCSDKSSIGLGFNEFTCTRSIPMGTFTYSSIATGYPESFDYVQGSAAGIIIQDPCNALNEVKETYNYNFGPDDDTPTNAPTSIGTFIGDNDCIDPTKKITYKFTGDNCAQSDSTMTRNSFSCEDSSSGQTIGTGTYYIEATGGSGNNEYFSGSVPVGSEHTLNEDGAFDSLGSATIKVYTSQGGDVLQTITVNDMICTNPLFLFDKFGASQVTKWVETSGRVVDANIIPSKGNVESVADADADVSTSTSTSTGGVAALDTGSSTATTNTVTIAVAFVVVVASAITLI